MKARRFLGLMIGLFLCIVPLSAFATSLADLLAGTSIQVGDKIFYNFREFSATATGVYADPMVPRNISVVPLITTINGIEEIGLRLQSALFYAGPSSSQDTAFKYNVTTVSGADIIADSFLRVGGLGVIGYGSVNVKITAADENGHEVATNLVGTIPGSKDGEGAIVFAQVSFSPQDILIISEDIKLVALDSSSATFNSTADQLYSQVPEPSLMVLLVISIMSIAGLRRWWKD